VLAFAAVTAIRAVVAAPPQHLGDDGLQRAAALGECVLDAHGAVADLVALDQAGLVEVGEGLREHLRGDAVDPILQSAEPRRPVAQQPVHDDRVPLAADDLLHLVEYMFPVGEHRLSDSRLRVRVVA
jgi:hypothetical protein